MLSPPPGDLPNLGIKLGSPAWQVDCLLSEPLGKLHTHTYVHIIHIYTYICISVYIHMCVLFAQLCSTLCDSMDCSSPGSFVHGILQARILEWIAIPFSRGSSQPGD